MDEPRKIRLDKPHAEVKPIATKRSAELLRQGQTHHRQREYAAAVTHYELAIGEDPDSAESWHLLGLAQLQSGELDSAIDSLAQATKLDIATVECRIHLAVALLAGGEYEKAKAQVALAKQAGWNDPSALVDLGFQFFQSQRFTAAKECFELAVTINDCAAFAFNCLGVIAKQDGDHRMALRHLETAVNIAPDYAEAHNNLGNVCRDTGDWAGAEYHYSQALSLDGHCHAAKVNLAIVATHHQQYQRAIELCEAAIQEQPDSLVALATLGNVYQEMDDRDRAIECYESALRTNPHSPQVLSNLSAVLRTAGQTQRAIETAERAIQLDESATALHHLGLAQADAGLLVESSQTLRRANALAPDSVEILSALGNSFALLGQVDEAVSYFRRTVECDPGDSAGHNNLGNMLLRKGDLREAAKSFERVAELDPHPRWKLRQLRVFPTVFDNHDQVDAFRHKFLTACQLGSGEPIELETQQIAQSGCEPPFQLQFLPGNLRGMKQSYARLFKQSFGFHFRRRRPSKPRIAFIVTRGHERVFLRSFPGLLSRLDTTSFDLVVACSPSGRSIVEAAIDRRNCSILLLADDFCRAAQQLVDADFDVLNYPEIGTDSLNYFLPFCRLAPLQTTSFGIQVTSGIPAVDYYLSSELVEPPDAANHYSEKLILARSLLPFRMRSTLNTTQPKPRGSFGLRDEDHVYLCAQQLGKFHPDFDARLGEILHRDKAGKLVLVRDKFGTASERLLDRFKATLPDLLERIVFVPYLKASDYLQLIANADVLLDPPHFGGVNSSYDAFSLGKPVVTLPTGFHRGRYTMGCYHRMGIGDCVVATPSEYVDRAVEIGCNRSYRDVLCTDIADASECLFEDEEAVQEHQRVFERWIEEART